MIRFASACTFVLSFLAAGVLPAADPAGKPRVILCLGDSITRGVRSGVTPEQTFAFRLEQQLRAEGEPEARVINVGVGGEQTDQALTRLGKVLNDHKPDVVTIMYGTNDSYVDKGATVERIAPLRFRANLVALVERIRRFGAEPVLMTEPRYAEKSGPNGIGEHCNIRLETFVAITRQVAEELQTPLIDHFAGWTAAVEGGRDLRDWTTDGYHPNPAGHEEMAARMLALLTPRNLPDAIAWVPQHGSSILPREWSALKVPGVQIYARPGAVYFVFPGDPRGEISFPRLNNVVKQVWVRPLKSLSEEPEPTAAPWTPPVDSLQSLRQTPTAWTISFEKEFSTPAVVVLEVDGVPTLAPEGHICRPGRDGVIVLPAHHAIVHGEKLQFEPLTHKNTVGYWVNPKDWAEWKFEATPGEYELHIFQGCGGHAGSDVVVKIGASETSFQVAETSHFQNFRWQTLGKVTLAATDVQTLELRCQKLAKGAVMDVRQIRLVPVNEAAASPSAANLWDVAPDVVIPSLTRLPPGPGRRCVMQVEGEPAAYHTVYFPTDWNKNRRWPILAEWTGNGPYRNDLGDFSSGRLEDGELAIGLAGTDGAICLSLPYLDDDGKPVTQWWGTPPEHNPARTLKYAQAAIANLSLLWNGSREQVVLTGFSRGAIAAHALGLHDDEIAAEWKGFICFSHFDGVRKWPFAGSDPMSAQTRRQRLGDRPVLVLAESSPVAGASLKDVKQHLEQTGANLTNFEFAETGFVNHDDAWALRPSAARERVRAWLLEVVK